MCDPRERWEGPGGSSVSNKQPFYHRMDVLFTATADVSTRSTEFQEKLTRFLRENLGSAVLEKSVEIETFDADPGDPADLM